MSKHIQLTIADPCHENWENMTPSEKGKFCGACQKQVVDFTDMSDSQVATFFKNPSTGSVCGRFMNDQLDRDITIPRKRIPWIKYFFQLSLPLFLASLKSNAQKGRVAVNQIKTTTTTINKRVVIKGDTDVRIVVDQPVSILSGKIVNQEGNPVPYASVMLKGTDTGAPADSSGYFNLRMP
ncbi:MAG: carboxypeptidase-like regulatory domain-containing protein, partial [Chitinophagaceae bacterium]